MTTPNPKPQGTPSWTTRTYRIPLAGPEHWLPLSALWPDGHVATAEEQHRLDDAIEAAYKKALRRRHAARSYAKKHGKPMPPLDEPIVPMATDFPWNYRPAQPVTDEVKRSLRRLNGGRDIWTPESAKRLEAFKAEQRSNQEAARVKRIAIRRIYDARAEAKNLRLPLPLTPTELAAAGLHLPGPTEPLVRHPLAEDQKASHGL